MRSRATGNDAGLAADGPLQHRDQVSHRIEHETDVIQADAALNEALEKLDQQDPVKARLVTLRYFGGMTIEQASEALGISRVTAHRYWTYSRAFLHQQITGAGEAGEA